MNQIPFCSCLEFIHSTMNHGNHEWWMLRIYTTSLGYKAVRLPYSWLP